LYATRKPVLVWLGVLAAPGLLFRELSPVLCMVVVSLSCLAASEHLESVSVKTKLQGFASAILAGHSKDQTDKKLSQILSAMHYLDDAAHLDDEVYRQLAFLVRHKNAPFGFHQPDGSIPIIISSKAFWSVRSIS
jgi:hypothetical protein